MKKLFVCCVSCCVEHTRSPKIWICWAPSPRDGGVADLRNAHLWHVHAEFDCSRSNGTSEHTEIRRKK